MSIFNFKSLIKPYGNDHKETVEAFTKLSSQSQRALLKLLIMSINDKPTLEKLSQYINKQYETID